MSFSRTHTYFFRSFFLLLLIGVAVFFIGDTVLAQADPDVFGVTAVQEQTRLGGDDIRVTIARIINVVLMFLGTIAFGLVLYGGFVYMTSGGSEEKIAQAKKILINATIGLAIVLSSFAITQFVLNKLQQATQNVPAGEDELNPPAGDCADIGNCPQAVGQGGAPDAQCLQANNLFVVQSLSPSTAEVDGDTGMTNVTVRAVFSQRLHQDTDIDTLFHVRRAGEENDIEEADVRITEGGVVAEAEFAVATDQCTREENGQVSCLDVANFTIEIDENVKDIANRVLEIETECGDFPRDTSFINNVDAIDNNAPTFDPLQINGQEEDLVGDDAIILRRGFTYPIESVIRDRIDGQGGIGYFGLVIERVRPGGNGPVDRLTYYDGPRISAGTHGPYAFLYRLPLGNQLPVPAKYTVDLRAHDIDGNSAGVQSDFIVVGENCQNGRQDEGEIGIDIGGECLGMGQCNEDWECASNKCKDGQCVAWPKIQDMIPASWDGAEGNYVTIVGRFFGADAGVVEFGYDRDGSGEIGDADGEWVEAEAPAACAARNVPLWTDSWVIVEVPQDGNGNNELPIGSESIIRITKNVELAPGQELFQDTSIDAHGPKPGPKRGFFTKNEIKRPGLCSLEDIANNIITEGVAGDTVVAVGSGFGPIENGKIEFGNVAGDIDNWADERAQTQVPEIIPTELFVSVSSGAEQSNGIGFTVISENERNTQPFIESIDPASTTPGSLLTVFGRNFGNERGHVFLAESAEAAAQCRAGGNCIEASIDLPGNCGVTWEDTQIIVQLPSDINPQGYFIAVRAGDRSSAGDTQLTVNAGAPLPGICRIEPGIGPAPRADNDPIVLSGMNFSGDPVVYFSQRDYDPLNIATWLNSRDHDIRDNDVIRGNNQEQISTLIPENDQGFSMNLGPGKIKVRGAGGALTNAVEYTVTDCRVDDAAPGDANEYRCCEEGSGAGIWVRNGQACPGETRQAGYIWRFTTGQIPNVPQVIEQCNEADWDNVAVGDVDVPSPAPWQVRRQGEQACVNASVVVRFSTIMNVNTLNNDNVKMFLCEADEDGDANCEGDARVEVPAEDLDLDYENGVLWIKRGGLAPNQWYHIELSNTIESKENVRIAGVNRVQQFPLLATRPCGAGTAYCFDFKTGNGECQLTAASINPPQKTTNYLGVIQDPRFAFDERHIDAPPHPFYFYVWGRGSQVCQPLSVDGLGWEWNSEDVRVEANIAVNEEYADSRATVLANANTAPESIEIAAALDEADDLGPMEATSDITVDLGDPTVVRYWPFCTESCTNAVIGLEFSRMMNFDTYPNGFSVRKCEDEFCRRLFPGNIALDVVEPDSPFRYRVRPVQPLDEGAWYLAQATDQIISIGSINPLRNGPALIPFQWKFRTKQEDGFCQIDSVRIEPDPFTAQFIGEKTRYLSIPYSSPDTCSALGQELNPWGFGWDWESQDPPVASVSDFRYYGDIKPYCTASCLFSGSDIARDSYASVPPVCGDGVIGPGEDCDIAMDGEVAGTSCSLSCLRPGNPNAGDDVNGAVCGNGVVNTAAGEECDPANAEHGQYCRDNCTWEGSSSQPPQGEEERAWCGSGGVPTFGEDCDINISIEQAGVNPQYSQIGCSSQCLHLGTQISEQWCALHRNDSLEAQQACRGAVSICGNGQVELGEECEVINNGLVVRDGNGVLNVNVEGAAEQYCSNTCMLQNLCAAPNVPSVDDGGVRCDADEVYCSNDCRTLGSSVYYDNPSMCSDAELEVGEYALCELTDEEARRIGEPLGQNPIQMVTAEGRGLVVEGEQSTDIVVRATMGPQQDVDGNIIDAPINPPVAGIADYTLLCGFSEFDEQQALIDAEAGIVRVADGNMEADGVANWGVYVNEVSNKQKSQEVFIEGRQSLFLSHGQAAFPGLVRQADIAVEPGAHYRLSLQYSLRQGEFAIAIGDGDGIFADFDGGNHLDGGDTFDAPDDAWRAYVRDVEIPEDVDNAALLFRVRGDVYIDAVRFERVIDTPIIQNDCPENPDQSRGVGTNSCCYNRPARTAEYPEHGSINICRNTLLSVDIYNERPISERSVTGNIILAEGREEADATCAIGQTDVTRRVNAALAIINAEEHPGFFRNIWDRVRGFFARIFTPEVHAARVNQAGNVRVWCAGGISVDPTVSYEWNEDESAVTSTIAISIDAPLEPSALYAVILTGGLSGIQTDFGVSLRSQLPQNPNADPAGDNPYLHTDYFTFRTGEDICKLKSVSVDPPQQLFTVPLEEHDFGATTQSINGQQIQPIARVYNWEWLWGPENNDIFTIPLPPAERNTSDTVIAAKEVEGTVPAVAQAIVTADADGNAHVGRIFSGISQLTAKFCENPWPGREQFPYVDNQFNFSMEYCADAGASGTTVDDLPFLEAVLGEVEAQGGIAGRCIGNFGQECFENSDCGEDAICAGRCGGNGLICVNDAACRNGDVCVMPQPAQEGQVGLVSDDTLKRTLFFNPVNEDVIGVQILQNTNPERLSASAWFEQNFPFGQVQRATVAGYDAVTDGNNYYVNALNQQGDPGDREVYNNIYVFSINENAQADTRNVFEQLLASLSFNTNLTDYGYCLHENVDANQAAHERKIPVEENDLRSFAEAGFGCSTDFDCKQQNGQPLEGTNGVCSNAKTKFLRDWQRLQEVKTAQAKIQAYRENIDNAGYPELAGGTYIPQYTNSRWPSWGLLGGMVGGLPIDPINRWSQCEVCGLEEVEEEGEVVVREVCRAQDPQTCWNQDASTFYCPLAMSIVEYKAEGTQDYTLHVPLEYFGENEDLIQEFVSTTHFSSDRWCQPLAEHNPFVGRCGDGVINAGEDCDPPGTSQAGFNHMFDEEGNRILCLDGEQASRTCTNACTWEYSQCSSTNICGDGIIQGAEICDDGALNGRYGHCDAPGQRAANDPGCRSIGAAGFCGNGSYDAPEEFCELLQHNGRSDAFQVVWRSGDRGARVYYGAQIPNNQCGNGGLHAGLCNLVNRSDIRENHCEGDPALLCLDNNDCLAPDRTVQVFNPLDPRSNLNFSDDLQDYGPCVPIEGNVGAEYNHFEELSCRIDCLGVGGFCGDGIVNGSEQCDDGNDNEEDGCTSACYAADAAPQEDIAPAGSCGDGVVQTPNNDGVIEACDAGANNGVACDPAYGESCVYCAANCSEVLTVDAVAYCGNGVIDPVEFRIGIDPNTGERRDNIPSAYEACDIVPGTDRVIARNEDGDTQEQICTADEGYVARGAVTCDNECQVLNTSNCVSCGLYGNAGKAVPKLALLNVLTPRQASSDWAARSDDLRQYARDENGRPIINADGSYEEGNPVNSLSNHTRLTLNEARDSWSWYDAIYDKNRNSAFLCLQQSWNRRAPLFIAYSQRAECQGNNKFTDVSCKEEHKRYVNGWDYTNYMQSQWLCNNSGTLAPLDREYGYETISPETIAENDSANWEWENYTEDIRQIESHPLCTEEYSVYFGSRGVQSERAQEYWQTPTNKRGDFFDEYGDFFPYPVDGEPSVVQNSMIISPAVPRENFRVVVRSKPSDDDGAFGFVGNVYSSKYTDQLAQETGGRLSYVDLASRDTLCGQMELGDANDGIWNGYWMPKTQNNVCTVYSGTTMNLLGTIRNISAQATTIDVGLGNSNAPFAFYVSAVTNNQDVPITAFNNRDIQVEVYTYHEGQVPSYSVYKPKHVFTLRQAEQSGNANLAKYWHVFNIVNEGRGYQVMSAERDPQSVGSGAARHNGSVETGFVDVLCNVPEELCDRE